MPSCQPAVENKQVHESRFLATRTLIGTLTLDQPVMVTRVHPRAVPMEGDTDQMMPPGCTAFK